VEAYAIKVCAVENLDRNYRNRKIYILPDSQAAIKALCNHQMTSKLVPGHEGIAGNETADQLAKTGSEHPFRGPEPGCGISVKVGKKAIWD
jgi:ribonuclease HI